MTHRRILPALLAMNHLIHTTQSLRLIELVVFCTGVVSGQFFIAETHVFLLRWREAHRVFPARVFRAKRLCKRTIVQHHRRYSLPFLDPQ